MAFQPAALMSGLVFAGSLLIVADPPEVEVYARSLRDNDASIRTKAATALGKIGKDAEGAVPALIDCIDDRNVEVRRQVIWAIGNIGPTEKCVAPIRKVLRDDDAKVREMAAWVIGIIGPKAKEAIPALRQDLKDRERTVRLQAAWALGNMGTEARPAVASLSENLKDTYRDVRGMSAWALGKIGPGASDAVGALVDALADSDAEVRMKCATALGEIAEKVRSPVALKKMENDKDESVRKAVNEALKRIEQSKTKKQ